MALNKASLKGRIKSELSGLGINIAGYNGSRDRVDWLDKLAEALANAVVDEIQANSELVPISTDSGQAGAGIITGKVA